MNRGNVFPVWAFILMIFMSGMVAGIGVLRLSENPILVEQFLLEITYMNFRGGVGWNVLGVLWLMALWFTLFRRFTVHFSNSSFPKPSHNPRSHLWYFAVMVFAFIGTMLIQMIVDDLITTPINLAFGSWNLLAPHLGEFTISKLFWFKVDVYCLMILYSMVFYLAGIWQYFHFTKYSALWLSLTVLFQILLGSQHVFYFLDQEGYARLVTFWVSYPWFRILTGLFAASVIKKPLNRCAVD